MLENNVFRMMMFIGAIIVVAILIHLLTQNYGELKGLVEQFFAFKLQKY